MYEAFYGLKTKPFQLNPDPSFYFSSKQHRRARAYLEYGVMRCEGFIVITGEVGAGKTTIVRGLLESLAPEKIVSAHLVSTQLGAEDTLRLVGGAFGVPVHGVSKSGLLLALEAYFITQALNGKRCLLIVDEAQNLQPQAVEELRMLSNFQNGRDALLQTFLVGQPEFRDILQGAGMLQLRQRVTASCHLGPLDVSETRDYIFHRLKCAGASEYPTFAAEVFEKIYAFTGGIPRRINSLCDRILLQGFLADCLHVDMKLLDSVLDEFRQEMQLTVSDEGVASLDVDSVAIEQIECRLSQMTAERLDDRLARVERSILQQEQLSMEILMQLRRLVSLLPRASSINARD